MAIVGGTWSYSGSPASSLKDQVRFLIGDTDQNDQLISDQEIDWLISSEGNIYRAAAMVCESLSVSGNLTDKKVGDLEIKGSQRSSMFRSRAIDLRHRAALAGVGIYGGGVSLSDKDTYEDDTDINEATFIRGQGDYPGTNQRGGGSFSSTAST